MVNSKKKGSREELKLANKLKEYGYDTRRTAQYNGKELDSKADIIGLDGIHIECKAVERLNIHDAVEQAIRDNRSADLPAVFHKKNRKPWLVTMTLDDWMTIYNEWRALG